jgi:hypothetical protein
MGTGGTRVSMAAAGSAAGGDEGFGRRVLPVTVEEWSRNGEWGKCSRAVVFFF